MLAGCFTAREHILLVCKAHEKPVCQGGLICLPFFPQAFLISIHHWLFQALQ